MRSRGGTLTAVRRPVPLHHAVLGMVLGGMGLFVLLSLLSWCQSAAASGGVAAPTANWGGLVGHRLARTLVQTLGGGAFLAIGLLWQVAFLRLGYGPRQQRLAPAIGGGLLLLGTAPLLQLSLAAELAYMGDAGGWLGRFLVALLVPYCNVGGTWLIGAIVGALGGLLALRPLWPLARRGASTVRALGTALASPVLRHLARRRQANRRRFRACAHPPLPGVVEPASATAAAAALDLIVGDTPAAAAPPSLSLLNPPTGSKRHGHGLEPAQQAQLLERTLRDFGVAGHVVQVSPGPVVTRYAFAPASGMKVSRIVNLADDLALGMQALSVRIVAPVPGKSVVGIEVPNPHREPVFLRDIVASAAFQHATSKLVLALGKDILGTPTITDLAQIPHLLIAGATGSGKSVGLNSMICSILLHTTPAEVKFIMIDPKMLELSVYDGIPHLIAPVVTHPQRAAAALRWAVDEMARRYRLLADHGVRGVEGYNQAHPAQPLPYIVIVIDELADLMLVARREVEDALTRLAQMARAAGIHLLVATQRPSVDVLTGIIKANFPARLSFQVSSRTDSRTILDAIGAERLLGKGDMLFLCPGASTLWRIHGAYVAEAEIKHLVARLRTPPTPVDDAAMCTVKPDATAEPQAFDDKYEAAVALVARLGQASASLMQRHLRIGYRRAARLIDVMERQGVVGPAAGRRPRQVYVKESPGPPRREAPAGPGEPQSPGGHGESWARQRARERYADL